MRQPCIALVIIALSTTLASCNRSEHITTNVVRKITVTGSAEGVERFVKLQGSAPLPLSASAITSLGQGRAEATVTIPANFGGNDLVHTTREALAAGLSYRFDEQHSTKTVAS